MNIHPLFVHFPIALLTVYAVMEMIFLKRFARQMWWWNTKALLLAVGVVGGFAALQTGEMAEGLRNHSALIEIHSTYATVTVWIFIILALSYLISGIRMYMGKYIQEGVAEKIVKSLEKITRIITWAAPVFAGLGLVTLVITGALGGAIVYGPETDPVVSFIYSVVVGF